MEDTFLDYFGEFDEETHVVVVKYFYFESEARLYAARLRTERIPCFISNAHTITALPLGSGGIGLHVKERDLQQAAAIVARMDFQNRIPADALSFYDADHDDIAFEKEKHATLSDHWYWLVLIIIGLIILRAFMRAIGFSGNWGGNF